jgi:hypothetical protein
MRKARTYQYTREVRIEFATDLLKKQVDEKHHHLIQECAEWVVDYSERKRRKDMRLADFPSTIFELMGADEESDGLMPNEFTGQLILLLYALSDPKVKRGGVCQLSDGMLYDIYTYFMLTYMAEYSHRKGLLDYRILKGDIFTNAENEFSLLPLYEKVGAHLGITPQEAADKHRAELALAEARKNMFDNSPQEPTPWLN